MGDTIISKEIIDLAGKSTPDAQEIYTIGLRILNLAKTSGEFNIAYSKIADGLYKKQDYSKALKYYKMSDSISEELGDVESRFMANLYIAGIYQRVGLISRARKYHYETKKLSGVISKDFPQYMLLQQQATFLEDAYDYYKAIPIRRELLKQDELRILKDSLICNNYALLINSYSSLAYDYLKCDQSKTALIYIIKADDLVAKVPSKEIKTVSLYYLTKGIFALETNHREEAKTWFEKAFISAKMRNSRIQTIKILEERINYSVDNNIVRKKILKDYNKLKQINKDEANRIISSEENVLIKEKEIYLFRVFGILICSFVIIVLIVERDKNKKLKIHFEKVLLKNDIQQENFEKDKEMIHLQISEEKKSVRTITISDDKKNELLAKLETFEKGQEYLGKNFNISNMATLFNTNPKYINHILQNYRDKNFNDYINHLRIKYIIETLQNHSEYLNYKISYLAELCGYSSHSRFASVFKKEIGISPSDFIVQLTNKKEE